MDYFYFLFHFIYNTHHQCLHNGKRETHLDRLCSNLESIIRNSVAGNNADDVIWQ